MKKLLFIFLFAAFLISDAFPQYFNTTQISILMGTRPNTSNYDARTEFFPSITMTNGKRFNAHWAAGVGVGYERFDWNLFPLFADIRYTLLNNTVSPFFACKTGFTIGNLKKKHYDELTLPHDPYFISDADYKKSGGLMVHPEIGVTIPLSENAGLLFTVAYRYQKIKSTVYSGTGNKEHYKENLNRLTFGVGITFR